MVFNMMSPLDLCRLFETSFRLLYRLFSGFSFRTMPRFCYSKASFSSAVLNTASSLNYMLPIYSIWFLKGVVSDIFLVVFVFCLKVRSSSAVMRVSVLKSRVLFFFPMDENYDRLYVRLPDFIDSFALWYSTPKNYFTYNPMVKSIYLFMFSLTG